MTRLCDSISRRKSFSCCRVLFIQHLVSTCFLLYLVARSGIYLHRYHKKCVKEQQKAESCHEETAFLKKKRPPGNFPFPKWRLSNIYFIKRQDYLYSSQLLIAISSIVIVQNAWIKALAKRAFVTRGIFRSTAARRIL